MTGATRASRFGRWPGLPSLSPHPRGDGDDLARDPVSRRVAAAAVRLSPSPAALARMEAVVMASFERMRAAEAAPVGPASRPSAAICQRLPRPWLRTPFRAAVLRRAAAVGLAASMAVASVAMAAAQSGPGQPFYRLRLQIEALSLPAPGSAGRLDAEIGRADQRLADLAAAGRTGDVAAASDSAAAYVDALMGALDAERHGGDPAALAAALEHHEQELLAIEGQAAPPARVALEEAVAAIRRARDAIAPADAGPRDDHDSGAREGAGASDPRPGSSAARPKDPETRVATAAGPRQADAERRDSDDGDRQHRDTDPDDADHGDARGGDRRDDDAEHRDADDDDAEPRDPPAGKRRTAPANATGVRGTSAAAARPSAGGATGSKSKPQDPPANASKPKDRKPSEDPGDRNEHRSRSPNDPVVHDVEADEKADDPDEETQPDDPRPGGARGSEAKHDADERARHRPVNPPKDGPP